MKIKFKRYIKKVIQALKSPEMEILPGNISYYFILSLIPIITVLIYLTSVLSISISSINELINNFMPESIANMIIEIINSRDLNGGIGLFSIVAIFVASNGTYAIIKASNVLYGIKENNRLKDRVKAIVLLFLIIIIFIFLMIVPIFGNQILSVLKQINIINLIIDEFIIIFNIIKWPLTLLFIYFNIKLIYVIAPNKRIKGKYATYGAITTTFVWSIATGIFSYYLKYFSGYDKIYGSLSSIIVLMIWMYILSYIFVLGIAINYAMYKNDDIENNK